MPHKKKVLIYSEYWSSFGGGEKYLACCAETLIHSDRYDVTLIIQQGSFDKDAIEQYFKVDLARATVQIVPGDLTAFRHEAERDSADYDLFIYMTNYRFLMSHARQTFVILQVPYGQITSLSLLSKSAVGNFKEAAKDFCRFQMLMKLRNTPVYSTVRAR